MQLRAPVAVQQRLEALLGPGVDEAPTAVCDPTPGVDPENGCLQALNATVLEQCRSFATHAGVVAFRGDAVAFPASSGTGKSTLTAACVQSGLDYVSDEALVASLTEGPDGAIRPYPRPLGLSPWSLSALGLTERIRGPETALPPAAFGSSAAGPVNLRHVVLLSRGESFDAREIPGATVAMELLRRSFNHHRDPARAFTVTTSWAHRCSGWQVTTCDPHETAAWVRNLLGAPPVAAADP